MILTTAKQLFCAVIFISFLFSCKHEIPVKSSTDPCASVSINLTGNVNNASSANATDGSISVSASGANGFTYSLNNGAFQATGNFSGLPAGTYTVYAKSTEGCIGSAQFIVGNNDPCFSEPVQITGTVTNASSSTSADGSITVTASGGTGFQYKMNNGNYQSSGTFTGLASGNYSISAKNSNGCTSTAQFTVSAANLCGSKNISLTTLVSGSDKCLPTGSIAVSASGSSGFSYQINGSAYQPSNVFNNLSAGNYTITVKDIDNCTQTTSATITLLSPGNLFNNVRTLILNKCKPCHVNGRNNGGINFDDDCSIVSKKDRIKARAVDGIPTPMPTNGSLTNAEKQKITDWINAGGKYTN